MSKYPSDKFLSGIHPSDKFLSGIIISEQNQKLIKMVKIVDSNFLQGLKEHEQKDHDWKCAICQKQYGCIRVERT